MRKTILIVEDDELNRRLFTAILDAEGFRTRAANDGASALSLSRADRPDLVLVDIDLPGMSGLELAVALRRETGLETVPVIALTAHAMRGDRDRCARAGCDGYIPKPVSVRGLVDAVRVYCAA